MERIGRQEDRARYLVRQGALPPFKLPGKLNESLVEVDAKRVHKKNICFDDPFRMYTYIVIGTSADTHGSNIRIEIGWPANRTRAEGCQYVLETAFTVQRALCTFTGKGQPGQS